MLLVLFLCCSILQGFEKDEPWTGVSHSGSNGSFQYDCPWHCFTKTKQAGMNIVNHLRPLCQLCGSWQKWWSDQKLSAISISITFFFLWFIYCSLLHHVCKQGVDFQVFSLDGDGAVLMHMGALATIAQRKVPNFRHIVFNNGAHDSVGGQPTEARHFDDFSIPGIAMACGYKEVRKIQTS